MTQYRLSLMPRLGRARYQVGKRQERAQLAKTTHTIESLQRLRASWLLAEVRLRTAASSGGDSSAP